MAVFVITVVVAVFGVALSALGMHVGNHVAEDFCILAGYRIGGIPQQAAIGIAGTNHVDIAGNFIGNGKHIGNLANGRQVDQNVVVFRLPFLNNLFHARAGKQVNGVRRNGSCGNDVKLTEGGLQIGFVDFHSGNQVAQTNFVLQREYLMDHRAAHIRVYQQNLFIIQFGERYGKVCNNEGFTAARNGRGNTNGAALLARGAEGNVGAQFVEALLHTEGYFLTQNELLVNVSSQAVGFALCSATPFLFFIQRPMFDRTDNRILGGDRFDVRRRINGGVHNNSQQEDSVNGNRHENGDEKRVAVDIGAAVFQVALTRLLDHLHGFGFVRKRHCVRLIVDVVAEARQPIFHCHGNIIVQLGVRPGNFNFQYGAVIGSGDHALDLRLGNNFGFLCLVVDRIVDFLLNQLGQAVHIPVRRENHILYGALGNRSGILAGS